MKKFYFWSMLILIMAALLPWTSSAQAPEKFTYQAVVRNASNQLVASATVGVRVSILQGGVNGTIVYMETQTAVTNANGLITLQIGGGNVQQGIFSDIDWSNGLYFLKTETDPNGGSDYSVTSVQQLLSVPYALYSKEAGNGFSGDYNDLTNKPTIPQNVSELTNDAGYITMDSVPTVPTNVSAFANDAGYLTNYTETDPQFNAWDKDYNDLINRPTIPTIPTEVSVFNNDAGYITMDSIPTNVSAFTNDAGYLTSFTEQQVLTISNDTLFLTGGSFIKLPAGFDGDYNSLSNKPELFSGDYNDLINQPTIPTIPTDVSVFNNDAGYITMDSVPTNISALTNDAGYLTGYTETDPEFNAWDKDYNDLINKPMIPTIPTEISVFNNDAGYLTSFTEQQVLTISNDTLFLTGGSFVKLPAGFDGDYNSLSNKPELFSGDYNNLTNQPTIPTIPTDVSVFNNDAGYITMDSVPTIPANISAFNNDAGYLTGYTETDPQFNAWDKDYNDLTNKPVNADFGHGIVRTNVNNPSGATDIAVTFTGYALMNGGVVSLGFTRNVPAGATLNINNKGAKMIRWKGTALTDGIIKAGDRCLFMYNAGNESYYLLANDRWGVDIDALAAVARTGSYNDLSDKPEIPTVPTNVSAFTNDAGYLTGYTETDPQFNAWDKDYNDLINKPTIPTIPVDISAFNNDASYITMDSVPTNVSAFTNDAGYLTNYTENDPEFTAWDKDYNDLINRPNLATVAMSGNYNDLTNKPTIPTNVSAFVNDAGYLTAIPDSIGGISIESDPVFSAWNKDYNDLINTPTIPTIPNNVSTFANDAGYITMDSVPSNMSAFTNDAGYITAEDVPMQVNADWNATSGVAQILNKPELFSGDYNDLTNKPDLCECLTAADVQALINSSFGAMQQQLDSLQNVVDALTGGNTTATLPTVTTSIVSNITETTATCGGNVTADGGATVTERGVCWSTSQNPTVADAHTTDGIGTGTFTSSITGLTAGTTYYVRAYATNSAGTAYGEQRSFTTSASSSFTCGTSTVTDYDGNTYNTVQIGTQCWMKENIRTTHYADGTAIPAGGNNTSTTSPYYYNYSSSGIALSSRGYLYNWPAAMHGAVSSSANPSGVQGICPTGWHLPSDVEWTQLTDYVSSQPEYTCGGSSSNIAKALASETGWIRFNVDCGVGNDPTSNNASGFGAVPAGDYLPAGDYHSSGFYNAGWYAYFWSSTENGTDIAWIRYLDLSSAGVGRYDDYRSYGFSVRCLRDSISGGTTQTQPMVTTGEATDITSTSATLNGVVSNPDNVVITAQGFEWKVTEDGEYTAVNATGETMSYTLTGLTAGTGYTYRTFVTTAEGTRYGETVSFTTLTAGGGAVVDEKSCPGTPTVTDHEGNVYATVQIGNQCWMRENLRTSHYADGTVIPAGGDNMSNTEPYYYDYSTHSLPLETRGYLYNWPAAMHGAASSDANPSGVQGICPTGWHLPSDAEWTQLTNYVGSQSEYTCGVSSSNIAKALASETDWDSHSTSCAVGNAPSANNATGFSAVPAGTCYGSSFYGAGGYAYFWSSMQHGSDNAYDRNLYCNRAYVGRNYYAKYYGYSVRCLRDSISGGTTQTQPTVTTGEATDITSTSATLNGVVSNPDNVAIAAQGFEWKVTEDGAFTAVNATGETMSHTLTCLTASTGYTYHAFVTTAEGTSYGEAVDFTTLTADGGAVIDEKSCPGTPTVTDHEGNVYATVQIGNQCWMRDNLRTTTSPSTGTYLIPASGTGSTLTGKQAFWYNNDSVTYAAMNYGLLYNWNAAADTFNTAYGETSVSTSNSVPVSFTGNRRGICPAGWHFPSEEEWVQLTIYMCSRSEYFCGDPNGIAKALASTEGWDTSIVPCTVGNDQALNNASGFSAVPAGIFEDSSFAYAGKAAAFWSSTQVAAYDGQAFGLSNGVTCNSLGVTVRDVGLSIRCIRDENDTASLPTVTTSSVSNITATSASCGGNVIATGGATVSTRGVCWSASQNPTVSNSHTTNGSGTGNFTSNLTGLTPSTTYYVRAYATNGAGTTYGEQRSFTTLNLDGQSCPDTATVTDYDGNTYNTVQIGTQCWMKQNLRTTHYADGTSILVGGSNESTTSPYYYDCLSSGIALSSCGYLYNWSAAMHGSSSSSANPSGVQGICPTGWHLPSYGEWTQLTNYVQSQSQYVCDSNHTYIAKALAATTGWNTSAFTCTVGNNQSLNNATGFSAIPTGHFANYDSFIYANAGFLSSFWSSTQNSSVDVWSYDLFSHLEIVQLMNGNPKTKALSVRCLRDDSGNCTASLPTVSTHSVSNITDTNATCGGNVTSTGSINVTARGVCWSTSQNPMVSNSHTTDGSGTGSYTSSLTGLTAGTTYYVRAYATNSTGTAYGETVMFTTLAASGGAVIDEKSCPAAPTVSDYEGNVYATVQVGNQCWMRNNLRTTHYADGTEIPAGSSNDSYTDPYYYDYSSHSLPLETRGYLYNWPAAMHGAASSSANPNGVQGICPTDWHLPSDAEWNTMEATVSGLDWQASYSTTIGYRGSHAGKLAGGYGWYSNSTSGAPGDYSNADRNASGFFAVPVGGRFGSAGSSFGGAGLDAYFWSSTNGTNYAWARELRYDLAFVRRNNFYKYYGFSVRCLRDNNGGGTSSLPTVTTNTVSNITATTAACGGNVTSAGSTTVTARGVCWSTSQNPTVSNSHTTNGSGTGSFTSNITGLITNTTYYVRAYATNSAGTVYGGQKSFTTTSSFTCGTSMVSDYDGNIYNTVQIGTQCWMKQNLRTKHYADGTSILYGGSNTSDTNPYYYNYSSSGIALSNRGYLYNWSAAKVACPTGWHLPSDSEWTALTDYVGCQSEYTCGGSSSHIAKALASTEGWHSYSGECYPGDQSVMENNATGFSAVPAGYNYGTSVYDGVGYDANFWSSTELGSTGAYDRYLDFGYMGVLWNPRAKASGLSVRCLKD